MNSTSIAATTLRLPAFLILLFCTTAQARVLSYKKESEGVRFLLDRGILYLHLLSDDIVEVKYSTDTVLDNKKSLVILPTNNGFQAFSISETLDLIRIQTNKLQITVDRKTNAVSFWDSKGKAILSEARVPNKVMKDTTIAGIRTASCSVSFNSPVTEALYGLGCHPLDTGSINYKGRNQNLAIKYLTGAIPVLLSTRGYGLLWDNYSESDFYGAEAGNTRFTYQSESGKMIDYYFFYGPSFDQIIEHYRHITGRAPMYPKWAFGLFQSQDRYKTQEEFLSAKNLYRENHIPVDVIVQDWYYWYPLPIGSHVMEPKAYPDPKAMLDELHAAHLHGMISIWPCFGAGTANFNALQASGNLTDITWDNFTTHTRDTYYDAHSPRAREMYWQQARDSLIRKYGWDAWWVDQCEPDTEDPNTRKRSRFFTGRGIDYFNTYSLVHTQGIYTKWRRDIADKRIFLLARQAFAGSQRNASTLWSSDITTTFRAFKTQVPQGINACASGIPYWTSDIGGYLSPGSPNQIPDWSNPEYRELFTRWFQFGAFCPIFRIHGKGERALFSKNWDETTRGILLTYDNLRYRLLPYIYSLSAKITRDHYTLMRSLAFDFRSDSAVYNIPDQYMFGPAFLVNPVTEQLFSGANADKKPKTRKLYLPVADWYDFWTGERSAGGRTLSVPAPIGILPLYVKAGSIIPLGEEREWATQKPDSSLEIRIYPGADGQFTLYEDENNKYNYEKGAFSTLQFHWMEATRTLTISAARGTFPGMLHRRIFHIVLVRAGHGVGESPTTGFDKTIQYTGKEARITLKAD